MLTKWNYDQTTGLGKNGTGIRTSEELQQNRQVGQGGGLGYNNQAASQQTPTFSFTTSETTGGSEAEWRLWKSSPARGTPEDIARWDRGKGADGFQLNHKDPNYERAQPHSPPETQDPETGILSTNTHEAALSLLASCGSGHSTVQAQPNLRPNLCGTGAGTLTEEEAIGNSIQTARGEASIRKHNIDMGAVPDDRAESLLKSWKMKRERVKGDGACGITAVALQSPSHGALTPKLALRLIQETAKTLNATERALIFRASNLNRITEGGEEAYFTELESTTNTRIDAGGMVLLAHGRGLKGLTIFCMESNSSTKLQCITISLTGRGSTEPTIAYQPGRVIFVDMGQGHWDIVSPSEDPYIQNGAAHNVWYLLDGHPTMVHPKRPTGPQPPSARPNISAAPVPGSTPQASPPKRNLVRTFPPPQAKHRMDNSGRLGDQAHK
jgi:hypothetical protein